MEGGARVRGFARSISLLLRENKNASMKLSARLKNSCATTLAVQLVESNEYYSTRRSCVRLGFLVQVWQKRNLRMLRVVLGAVFISLWRRFSHEAFILWRPADKQAAASYGMADSATGVSGAVHPRMRENQCKDQMRTAAHCSDGEGNATSWS